MDVRQLEYFLAVVDHGGFNRAAAALYLAQPSLSQAIRSLERDLGSELFHRIGRRAVLTEAGSELIEPARTAVRSLRLARTGVESVQGLRGGGLDADIADPATRLSSGERQLLVLVRVFVSPASVIILDEATCHLDPPAEARAERAFATRSGTLIVIAHRIASARRARRILLLDGDRAELGTHDELLTHSAGYASLARLWTPEAVR